MAIMNRFSLRFMISHNLDLKKVKDCFDCEKTGSYQMMTSLPPNYNIIEHV